MRYAPLWHFTQPLRAISFGSFGKTRQSHLQYSKDPSSPNIPQSVRSMYMNGQMLPSVL